MILIIYPLSDPTLPAMPEEVADLANTFPKVKLVGIGNSERPIFEAIDGTDGESESVSGIWIVGHATPEGVILGSITLTPAALVVYAQLSGCRWIVFNTCYGDDLAQRVRMETGVATLGVDTRSDLVGDRDAWRLARALATALVRNDRDLGSAYRDVDPRGGGLYLYRPPLGKLGMGSVMADSSKSTPEQIHDLELRLALLEQQMNLKLEGIQSDLTELKEAVTRGPKGPSWNSMIAIMILAGIYFTALAAFITYAGG